MAGYVDGYVLPLPKKSVAAYRRMARFGAKLWMSNGAVSYRECIGDDMKPMWGVPFPRQMRAKAGETIVFAYVEFKSRAHRDRVNAKVMKDPRMTKAMPKKMPFDPKRMVYGGFEVLVRA